MQELQKKLLDLDVNDKTEKKKNLTYLSWAWAWSEVLNYASDATYEICTFENNLPYVFDPNTGYMVFTKVTINGLTRSMWLPVMDGANKAMKDVEYAYKTQYGEKTVQAASMFDINKTIMRCLTKNLAMFGLGLYIYAGEDLPDSDKTVMENKDKTSSNVDEIKSKKNMKELVEFYNCIKDKSDEDKKAFNEMRSKLSKGA